MWERVLELFIMCLSVSSSIASKRSNPHIIFIMADDLGWNDVGFHGSNQIPTPNLDALAFTGIILNNYYVTPICSPSRSALMTGKYPIHTGLQHNTISASAPYGLGLNEKILPEFLKDAGYTTRHIGKWHLGSFKKEYTPEFRGFDSHYGYWTGHQDYYDHTALERPGYWGYDMRRGMNISWSDYSKYTTDLLTVEAVKVIEHHDKKRPLFLYLAHLATHSANVYSPLQAPESVVSKFGHITNPKRRLFAGMLSKLDESVGIVTAALDKAKMLSNSVIIFSTDNGGPAAGFNMNAASNWPLRGVKDTLWEGGVRGAAFIWSPYLPSSKVSNSMIHITDWLPTLLYLTNATNVKSHIDGINVWDSLYSENPSSREEILLNIDTEKKIAALIYKNWKYIKGNSNSWNGWYGPSGRNMTYNWNDLKNSMAAKAIQYLKPLPSKTTIQNIRNKATVICDSNETKDISLSNLGLFNLHLDPCEKHNLAKKYPDIVNLMESKLKTYYTSMVPPRNKPSDPRGNPKYLGYAWTNWMDYIEQIDHYNNRGI